MSGVHGRIEALQGFWTRQFAYYLAEHRHPLNRLTHSVGIPIIVGTMVLALIRLDWKLFVIGQIVGWTFQVVGHRIEGNRPALTRRPISLLMGPFMVAIEWLERLGIRFEFAHRARLAISDP